MCRVILRHFVSDALMFCQVICASFLSCAGDHRLALLLSQAIGSEPTRQLLALQLAEWAKLGVDLHILPTRLRVFSLLAGKPVSLSPSLFLMQMNDFRSGKTN